MFPNTKLKHLFFWTIELLALSILVYLLLGFDFLMRPIKVFISTVFVPLVVAGFLYYVLKPLLTLIKRIQIRGKKIPHQLAVVVTFIFFLSVIAGALVVLTTHANFALLVSLENSHKAMTISMYIHTSDST